MMVTVETYLRRGQRRLQRLLLEPRLRWAARTGGYLGGGFVLSAASLMNLPLPLCMGLISAAPPGQAVLICLGAMAGYPFFWGTAGSQGLVWSAAGGLLAVMVGRDPRSREQPMMIPVIAALLTAVTGLCFQAFLGEDTPVVLHILRTALALLSGMLFAQAFSCRDAVTHWLIGGLGVLALAQVEPLPNLVLGYVAAGLMTVTGAFPEAALAGLALDLARITQLPMTAVTCMAWLAGMIPFDKRWQHYAAPAGACLAAMAVCGVRDLPALAGLALGGGLGAFLPPRPLPARRRGETGLAQVRLELGARLLESTAELFVRLEPPPIDREALLEKARQRACGGCSARNSCAQSRQLDPQLLERPLDAQCRKSGRLIPELRRAQDQYRAMQAQRAAQGEYRGALRQQYRFLGAYLRRLADRLPRKAELAAPCFRVQVSARSKGKDRANGDRCVAFSGADCCYYVLLCDGMGTGMGAAEEGCEAAAMLHRMLSAGFPAEHALASLNSLLALRGAAGAVTVDLARIRLDTGIAELYKWGAAPSWVLTRGGAEKIGTASAPPGISVGESREMTQKLSLRRGEVLILLSDGVDGEEALRRSDLSPDAPPGELAAKILEGGCGGGEDDATAAVIRLRPTSLATS